MQQLNDQHAGIVIGYLGLRVFNAFEGPAFWNNHGVRVSILQVTLTLNYYLATGKNIILHSLI
jgi:hypothetical protein